MSLRFFSASLSRTPEVISKRGKHRTSVHHITAFEFRLSIVRFWNFGARPVLRTIGPHQPVDLSLSTRFSVMQKQRYVCGGGGGARQVVTGK